MFLSFLRKHNQALIDIGIYLLEKGLIEPDTYVLDLDSMEKNAEKLAKIAGRYGIVFYFMAKQLGRNPETAKPVSNNRHSQSCQQGFGVLPAVL